MCDNARKEDGGFNRRLPFSTESSVQRPAAVPFILLLTVLILRPHFSGATYAWSQGPFLCLVFIGLALVLLSPRLETGPPEDRLRRVLILPWVLCGWSFLSILWSADQGRGVEMSFALLLSVGVFALTYSLTRRWTGEERSWASLLLLVLVPVLAHALYQHLFGMARLRALLTEMGASGQNVSELMGVISRGRVFAGFLNANMLAGFLAVFIPLTLDLAIGSAQRSRRFLFIMLTVGQTLVLILTGSVGGTLAAVGAAAFVFLVRRGVSRRELVWMAAVGITLFAGIIMVRGLSLLPGPDNSIVQRIGYMKAGILMAAQKPLVGWGAGSSPGALMGYVGEGIRPVTDPHNFLIRSWIAWGAPGVVILLFFLVQWARAVLHPIARKGWKKAPAGYAGLCLGSAAFLFHGLMDMDFNVPETALFGWFALAATLGTAAVQDEGQDLKGSRSGAGLRWTLAGACLALVLPSLVLTWAELNAFRADRAVNDGRVEEAAGLYKEAGRFLPFNGRLVLEEGRTRLAAGQREEALMLFERADRLLRFSPYPSWELGRAAQLKGDWSGSIPYLRRALARYPTSPRILIDLAQAHYQLGDYREAIRILQEVKRLSLFDPEAGRVADRALERPGALEGMDGQEDDGPIPAH